MSERIAPATEELTWEYDTVGSEGIGNIRDYLYRRRKLGWKLFWIEGTSLHFRRPVGRPVGRMAA